MIILHKAIAIPHVSPAVDDTCKGKNPIFKRRQFFAKVLFPHGIPFIHTHFSQLMKQTLIFFRDQKADFDFHILPFFIEIRL